MDRNSQQPIPAVGDELETGYTITSRQSTMAPQRLRKWHLVLSSRATRHRSVPFPIHQTSTNSCIVWKGKSVWVYYVLRRRLAERKPVIWYREGSCLLFVEEGVYQAPDNFRPSFFHKFVWTIVDSDDSKEGIPTGLVPHGTRLFMIYSTSPSKERWKRLHKTTSTIRIIMNTWTRTEISYA